MRKKGVRFNNQDTSNGIRCKQSGSETAEITGGVMMGHPSCFNTDSNKISQLIFTVKNEITTATDWVTVNRNKSGCLLFGGNHVTRFIKWRCDVSFRCKMFSLSRIILWRHVSHMCIFVIFYDITVLGFNSKIHTQLLSSLGGPKIIQYDVVGQ